MDILPPTLEACIPPDIFGAELYPWGLWPPGGLDRYQKNNVAKRLGSVVH